MILGIPAAAHREALLRETAGGGRMPTAVAPFVSEATKLEPAYGDYGTAAWSCPHCGQWIRRMYQEDTQPEVGRRIVHLPACDLWALVLHDPADPEAGAMGLARLAWVAEPGSWWSVGDKGVWWEVMLDHADPAKCRAWTVMPRMIEDRGGEVLAIGFVARVHLGLLDREEVTS